MLYKSILKKFRKNKICPFCKIKKSFIILENKFAYLTPAKAPYEKDHLLVIPKRHVLNLVNLKKDEKNSIFDLINYGIKILKKEYPAVELDYKEGDMQKSGKTISHLHFHLLPKTRRNRNFFISKSKRRFLSEKDLIKKVKELKKF